MKSGFWRRAPVLIAAAGLVLALAGAVWFGFGVWGDLRDSRDVRALAAGRDVAPRAGADPRVLHARALFLAERDRLAEAETLTPRLGGLRPDLLSAHHFAIANARMRLAFAAVETMSLDDAFPEVELAKAAYRRALRAWPENLDAKVNYDLAMRLLRDLPREGQDGEEDPENRPRRLWTDLPGLPRGAP